MTLAKVKEQGRIVLESNGKGKATMVLKQQRIHGCFRGPCGMRENI